MKNTARGVTTVAGLFCCLVLPVFTAGAKDTTQLLAGKALTALPMPSITRWVIASGGGVASNGGYQLRGAIGQPLAGTSTGGSYSLKSGYHSEDDLIFRNDMDQ